MRIRPALRSGLLALLIANAVAANIRRQDDPDPGDGPDPSTPASVPSSTSSSTTPSSTGSSTPSSTQSSTQSSSVSSPTSTPSTPPVTSDPITPPAGPTSLDPITVSASDSVVTVTPSASNRSSGSAAAPSETPKDDDDDDDGDTTIGTGPIVGMSVAGGLAVIGLIAFFVWKFTRKRFSTFDDNEPIKWPDLNSHGGAADSHPLPVRDTGRAGFETGSENSLSRVNSENYSTTDFNAPQDPYAVPPLPHLNPNQPYRDDPTSTAGYYDPYRGPVPPSVEHGQDWQGEAIPMNQIHAGGYDQQPPYNGRQSPGPMQAYDAGRASPAPANMGAYQNYEQYDHGATAGRQSPGPMAAYGGGGPAAAYGNAGYGAQPPGYGAR